MNVDNKINKIICGIDFVKGSEIGGPTINSKRIMNSALSKKIDFVPIYHDLNLGRGISIRRIIDLKKQIQEIKPDIIFFSGVQLAAFHILIASILARQRSRFMILRGFSFDALDISLLKRVVLALFIEPLCFLMCSKFVGNSHFSSNRLITKFFWWKNEGYIHNLPPENKEFNSYDLESLKNSLGISKQKIVISSVGRITADKGYKVLLESIRKLAKKRSDFVFLICGDGKYLNEFKEEIIKSSISENVLCLGKNQDIKKINSISDIFVLPSLHETLSSALIEASTSKCSLIASRTGGITEIVKDGFNGFTFTKGDSHDLLEKIEFLLDNSKLRSSMQLNALNYVENNFKKINIERKLEEFLLG